MTLDKNQTSETGEHITRNTDGILIASHHPIIPVTVQGGELVAWAAVQNVIQVIVEQTYAGERSLVWQDGNADDEIQVGLLIDSQSNVFSLLLSLELLLRQLDWTEAANMLQNNMNKALTSGAIPEDCQLMGGNKRVSPSGFCDVVMANVTDESVFDVDAAQYDELADRFHEEFEAGAEKTTEFAQKAMDKAREQLTVAGKFTEEQGHKLKEFLENDFSRVAQEMKKGAKEKLNPSRLGVGALASMSKLLHKTGVALSSFGDKADDALTCKSGEITSAGKLVCKACGYEMNFKKTGRIPPCPKCHKTEFTKDY